MSIPPLIRVILFDIGNVLLPGRDPYALWKKLIPDEETRKNILSKIRFEEWGQEWDLGFVLDCIKRKLALYPQEAPLIQQFADEWRKTAWDSPNERTIEIVRELKAFGFKLYLASNWPVDDFELAQPYMEPFLNLFDGKQISGEVHLIKPHPNFFEAMMKKFDFNAHEAIFVDDLKENVDAACSLGMEGIVFQSADQLRLDFIGRGLIKRAVPPELNRS